MTDLFADTEEAGKVEPRETDLGPPLPDLGKINVTRIINVQEINARSIAIRQSAENLVIVDAIGEADASDIRKGIKKHIKMVEDDQKRTSAPLLDLLERIRAFYRPIRADLDAAYDVVGKKITSYHDEQERKREEALRKLEMRRSEVEAERAKESAAMPFPIEEPPAEPPPPPFAPSALSVKGATSTTFGRKNLKFRVVDIKLVPPELVVVNEMKTRDLLRLADSQGKDIKTAVPGIEGYWEEISVTR